MKIRINMTIAALACLQFAACQEVKEQNYDMTVRVTDPEGTPISGAVAKFGMLKWVSPATMSTSMEEVPAPASNDKGEIHAQYKSIPHFNGGPVPGAYVTMPMFYPTKAESGTWLAVGPGKWKAEVVVTMKPVKNPIPMFANSMIGRAEKFIRIPEIGKEYGYDLMLCEPLPPLGGGKIADFRFKAEGRHTGDDNYNLTLKVWFSNKGEGLVMFETPSRLSMSQSSHYGSELQSDHEAPAGGYFAAIERHSSMEPGKPRVRDCDAKRNFYFKCRSTRAPDGKEVFHYGKIYGDFDFCGGGNKGLGFLATFGWSCTYFNPTPDDRNVEFDPKRNLLQGRDKLTVGWP